MPIAGRVLVLLLLCSTRAPALAAQAPTFQQISGYIEGGLEALGRGDTAGYRAGTGRAFAVAPGVPPVAYHHARALAVSGETDSAVILLERLAWQGAVSAFDAPSDSAFTALTASPAWRGIIGRIEQAKGPISNSSPAFELPERDLTAEGTAWDSKTRTLLSDSSRRQLFTPVPLADGTPTRYALGFQALEEDGRRVLLQSGGPGIASWLAVYPDDGVVVAILSNATGAPLGGAVRRAITDAFLRPPAPWPSPRPGRARRPP